MCWGGAGFEPRTTDLQSGALQGLRICSQVRYRTTDLQSCALQDYGFAVRCATFAVRCATFAVRCATICSQVRFQHFCEGRAFNFGPIINPLFHSILYFTKVGIRNLSLHLCNSAILRTTKLIAELRTKKVMELRLRTFKI